MPTDARWIHQAAAIPLRGSQLCLVMSSSGKRWIIPKGILEPGKTAGEIALQEAWEEAGLVGVLQAHPAGSYLYEKNGSTCHVLVFVLQVTQAAEFWPEREVRQRTWVSGAEALERLDDTGLRAIVSTVLGAAPGTGSPLLGRAKPARVL